LGIGDWGLGIGDWAQSPIPNPQSPIPNPQSPRVKTINQKSYFKLILIKVIKKWVMKMKLMMIFLKILKTKIIIDF
jgi:hypothetical protein